MHDLNAIKQRISLIDESEFTDKAHVLANGKKRLHGHLNAKDLVTLIDLIIRLDPRPLERPYVLTQLNDKGLGFKAKTPKARILGYLTSLEAYYV